MNRVDDKGKMFTERVRKVRVEVKIVTINGDMHGYIHLTPEQRVKDLLNNSTEQFLAITAATLRNYGNSEEQTIDFIALNKQYIVSVIPIDEDKVKQQQAEEYYVPM